MRFTLQAMLDYDNTLLDKITLPEGMDLDIMKDRILYKCGDLYPYIQVPEYLKGAFGRWFEGMNKNIYMMFRALNDDYSPTENTTWTDTTERNHTDKGNSSGNSNIVNTPDTTMSSTTGVNAFNSGTNTEREKSETRNTGTDTTKNNNSSLYNKEEKETTTQSRHGNIGVMTTAQIIQSELEMRKFNLYDEIVKLFEKEFMLQIY